METKFLIVGAGVSGLSFANFINSDDYIILEKENEVGGYCRTIYQDEYIWDYAGHFFHFNNEKIKRYFLENISSEEIIYSNKCTKIYYKSKLIDYPFQKNIHQLEKDEFIDCLYDLYNKKEEESYDNFKKMLYGKFGKSISEKFLVPYNEKLYACDLDKLDEDAMGRFFPYANIKEIIKNMKCNNDTSYNNTFLYPKMGAATFINVLKNKVKEDNLLLNTKLIDIDYKNKVALIDNGKKIKYKYLINTSPFNSFIKKVDSKLYDYAKKSLTYNKVLVFNLGFDKKSEFTNEHWIYVPEKKFNFYRIGFYNNILKSDKLSMYIEIGYSENQNINEKEQLELTLKNLREMKIISDHKLVSYSKVVMNPAYVHVSQESSNILMKYNKKLNDNDIFCIGRYGLWKYCSIEDSILDALKLAKKLGKNDVLNIL